MAKSFSPALLKRISEITNKRARTVLDRIVAHGSVSTDELKGFGYNHAPRAARDVRELGIQLKTTMVKSSSGRRMAAYSFADAPLDALKAGRDQLSKKLRDKLIAEAGGRCEICKAQHNFQIDHRVPYEIAGESSLEDRNSFQVLCGSCNRTKSWDCEHCPNLKLKDSSICRRCYWADQADYDHVKMQPERRVDVVWSGGEIQSFERLRAQAKKNERTVAEEIKTLFA